MGLDPFAIQQAEERLAAIKARSRLRPLSEKQGDISDRKEDDCPDGEEIKGLHEPFIQYLNLNEVLYAHSRTDRRTTEEKGRFDFLCMKNGRGCVIEFKSGSNPTAKLSEDQRRWAIKADAARVPHLVTNSLKEAIEFVREHLHLTREKK